jgi:hypothetical protein
VDATLVNLVTGQATRLVKARCPKPFVDAKSVHDEIVLHLLDTDGFSVQRASMLYFSCHCSQEVACFSFGFWTGSS